MVLARPSGTSYGHAVAILTNNRRRNAEYEIKMKKTHISIVTLALLSFAAHVAFAKDDRDPYRPVSDHFAPAKDRNDWKDSGCHGDSSHCLSAPEIDPGQALGALTLLTGTLAIVRGYRRRK